MIPGIGHDMSLQEAVEAPRWHSFRNGSREPGQTRVDERVPGHAAALAALGHAVQPTRARRHGSAVQLISMIARRRAARRQRPRPGARCSVLMTP